MTVTGHGRWRYRAADADGAAVRGEIDATSERDAVDALRRRSLWVVELTPILDARTSLAASSAEAPSTPPTASARTWFGRWGANDADLAVVMRAMATLLSAGVPLIRALTYASQESATAELRLAFDTVRAAVERGGSLSSAVANEQSFPSFFAPLIAAGEGSGTLDRSLALLADHVERRDALRIRLRSALVYPTILAIASTVGVLVILLFVVPRFAALIVDSGGTLPTSTRVLIAASAIVTRGWWMLLLVTGLGALAASQLFRDESARRRWDERKLAWPFLGRLLRTRDAAGYTRTLAVGLSAGVSLLGAMALARALVRNRYLQAGLANAEREVQGGAPVATAVRGLLPPLTERLLDAGEVSGDLAGMLARAADASDGEFQRAVTQAVSLIEPVMILGFGGVVGFVALALLQAIYGLNAGIL